MRKLTKVLSAVLLLAIVVSAFAMFSTFAAEGSTAEGNAAKTIYDMDALTSITVTNQKKNAAGQTVPRFVKGTDGGQSVWNFDWMDTKKGENPATGQFWAVGGLEEAVTIRDDAGIEGSRNPKAKNTDYFIIDFDVASDSILAQSIYFNIRQYASGKTFVNDNSIGKSQNSVQVGMDTNGRIYISNGDGSNTRYATFDSEEKYTHFTIVYDFHTAADGTITNKAYAYINGYYVGALNSLNSSTAYIYFIRVQQSNVLPADGANVKYSNFTVKTLPAGYTGTVTKSDVLGSTLYSLHNIPELAYCMQDLPETPENYKGQKIADIKRGDETIPVYDVDDLHGDLLDGDVVTVYKDVKTLKKYYAVKMVSKATDEVNEETGEPIMADVKANVIWQDVNGVELGAEGALFKAPNVLNVASSSAWAIIREDAIYAQGGQSLYSGSGTTAVINDPMWHALPNSGTQEVIFFEDYIGYGRSNGVEGSTSSGSSDNRITSGTTVFDMNGHTFTNAAKVTHFINIYGSKSTVIFKNGGITHAGGGNNLVMIGQGYSNVNVYFDNCNVSISGTILDHRSGVVVYHNSTVSASTAMSNTKAVGNYTTNFVVDNCDVSTTGVLVNLAQANKSGTGRYGSGNMCVAISNSSITSSNYIIDSDIYANQGHTAAEYIANVVNHNIRFIDSDIATTSTLLASDVSSIPKTGENVLDANVNVDIYGCSISANRLSYIYRGSTNKTLVDYLQNIDVRNSKLNISSSFGQGYSKGKMDAELVINIADGCMFTGIPANSDGIVTAEVKISDDSKWAYTSAEGYKYIITSAYDTYTYQLGNKAAETFYWNQAEGEQVDINKVVTTAETALYKYTWANEGKAYTANMVSKLALSAKSNLTLCDYIYFNLFINKAEYDAAIAAGVTVSGITVDENTEIINIDGTDYYKLQIKNIKLEDADKAVMTVGVSFAGAYGDSYASEKSFSVLGYAENILANSTDEKSVALIESLLNYIVAACNYASVDASEVATKAESLIEGKTFGDITGEAKAETLEGVEVAIRYGNVLYLGVKANAGDVITVSYTSADKTAVSITKTADENGEIYVAIKAYDFATDLTITRGADSATMNIQGYYNALADDAAAQAMVEAIYNYATAAAAYKATMAN